MISKKNFSKARTDKYIQSLLIIILLIIGLFLRVILLDRIPANFSGDEITQLGHVLESQKNNPNPFDLCFAGHHACFYTYMYMPFAFLMPNIVLAMRLPQAITSLAAVFLFYLIVKKQMSTKAAFLSSLLFSTSYWHLNFARSTWSNIFTVFLLLAGYWVYHFRDHMKSKYLILALTFVFLFLILGYPSGYLIVLALLIFPIVSRVKLNTFKAVFFSFLLALIISLPYLLFINKNPQRYLSRFLTTSSNNQVYKTQFGGNSSIKLLQYQIKKAISGVGLALPTKSYFIEPPRYYDENFGLLDRYSRILFYFGLITFIFTKKRDYFWIILLVFGGLFTTLSAYPPNPARTLFTLPCYYYFIALFLHIITNKSKTYLKSLVILICIAISILNTYYYFYWISKPETLSVRQPAVDVMEMDKFTQFSKARVSAGGSSANVYEWNNVKDKY